MKQWQEQLLQILDTVVGSIPDSGEYDPDYGSHYDARREIQNLREAFEADERKELL